MLGASTYSCPQSAEPSASRYGFEVLQQIKRTYRGRFLLFGGERGIRLGLIANLKHAIPSIFQASGPGIAAGNPVRIPSAKLKTRLFKRVLSLAEREGFEPSLGLSPH